MAKGKEELTARESSKRFSKALQELRKTMSPEELKELRKGQEGPLGFAEDLFINAPRDSFGSSYDKRGFSGLFGDQGISPEARAKEVFDAERARVAKEKVDKKKTNKNRARANANPSLLKGGVNYRKGGKVRGAGIARKGVRPAKMY